MAYSIDESGRFIFWDALVQDAYGRLANDHFVVYVEDTLGPAALLGRSSGGRTGYVKRAPGADFAFEWRLFYPVPRSEPLKVFVDGFETQEDAEAFLVWLDEAMSRTGRNLGSHR